MTFTQITLVLLVVGMISAGQILFKFAATISNQDEGNLWSLINGHSVLAIVLYALSTGVWLYVLREVPLSRAYPMISLSFVIVPILAWLLIGEPYNMKMVGGSAFIVLGVYFLNS